MRAEAVAYIPELNGMQNRALLIGINAYPTAPLNGCINDVEDVRAALTSQFGFAEDEIRLLQDGDATKSGIVNSLEWLLEAAITGSRILFHYSGHGTQMATGESRIEDAICPVDFDFSLDHALVASELANIFGVIPTGVEFNWVSDSCYSGDLTRALLPRGARPRFLPQPEHVRAEIASVLTSGATRLFRFETSSPLNGGFMSGCGATETSADGAFWSPQSSARANGAFTHCLLRALEQNPAASLTNLVQTVISLLRESGYPQTPEVKGNASIISQPFLAGQTSSVARAYAERLFFSLARAPTLAARGYRMTQDAVIDVGRVGGEQEPLGLDQINLSGTLLSIEFGDVNISDQTDLERLLDELTPLIAGRLVASKQKARPDFAISAVLSASQGNDVDASRPEAVPPACMKDWTASITEPAGSDSVSGRVSISGRFGC